MTILTDEQLKEFMENHKCETPIEIVSKLNLLDPEYKNGGSDVGASPDLIIKAMEIYKTTHVDLNKVFAPLEEFGCWLK